MEVIKNLGRAVGRLAEAVGEKHHKNADINRIRTVIRCEERAAEKEYLALGRYYYHNLRDKDDRVTEPHCQKLDEIEARLERDLTLMQAFYEADGPTAVIWGEECPEGECEEIDLAGVEVYDEEPCLAVDDAEAAGTPAQPDEPDENSGLPFEG